MAAERTAPPATKPPANRLREARPATVKPEPIAAESTDPPATKKPPPLHAEWSYDQDAAFLMQDGKKVWAGIGDSAAISGSFFVQRVALIIIVVFGTPRARSLRRNSRFFQDAFENSATGQS
jgi:hypothetical protein